jgi:hypothetical protein
MTNWLNAYRAFLSKRFEHMAHTLPDVLWTYELKIGVINAENLQNYSENLTEGTKGLFEKYGDEGFEVWVYPTQRNTVRPDWYVANTLKNATDASLVNDGLKIEGSYPGVPFPLAQTGLGCRLALAGGPAPSI